MTIDPNTFQIDLEDELATQRFAEDLALTIKQGDCIALSGDLGAGKTTLTRAVLRAMADQQDLEVPSPTFTLVQQYDLRIPIGHFDLYRLGDPSEIFELGLDDILSDGAAFIEWPEMAEEELPKDLIHLKMTGLDDQRSINITGPQSFMARLDRSIRIRSFLNENGYENASRRFLLGDASTRTYERMTHSSCEPMILMNSPKMADGPILKDGKTYSEIAHLAEDVLPFVAIAKYLRDIGLKAPKIYHSSFDDGFLIIEDLGAEKPIDKQNVPISERYELAIDVLAKLHNQNAISSIEIDADHTHIIPNYDVQIMQMEIELLPDWYLPFKQGTAADPTDKTSFIEIWHQLFEKLASSEKALVLRDYHSPNIIWRPEADGLDQIGIIDFQDALIGPSAYDVASLCQDARVTVSQELEDLLLERYIQIRILLDEHFDELMFRQSYAIMTAQRASKVIGLFVRLDKRDGKPEYLKHIPRIEQYLERVTRHEVLKPLRKWLEEAQILQSES